MKALTILILIALTQSALFAAIKESQAEKDFALGTQVGGCLMAQCAVFRGTFLGPRPKSGQSVPVHVTQWLAGDPSDAKSEVSLPYEESRDGHFGDIGGPLSEVWAEVPLERGEDVVVVLATKDGWGMHAGWPVLLTTNENKVSAVRSLLAAHFQLERSPAQVVEMVASLSRTPSNPALAGYLVMYLVWSRAQQDRELSASLLLQMLGNPSVPDGSGTGLPFWVLGKYDGLPLGSAVRLAIIRRLAEVGQQATNLGNAAILGLIQLAASDNSIVNVISPGTRQGLAENYRRFVNKKRLQRSAAFESQLGIQLD